MVIPATHPTCTFATRPCRARDASDAAQNTGVTANHPIFQGRMTRMTDNSKETHCCHHETLRVCAKPTLRVCCCNARVVPLAQPSFANPVPQPIEFDQVGLLISNNSLLLHPTCNIMYTILLACLTYSQIVFVLTGSELLPLLPLLPLHPNQPVVRHLPSLRLALSPLSSLHHRGLGGYSSPSPRALRGFSSFSPALLTGEPSSFVPYA